MIYVIIFLLFVLAVGILVFLIPFMNGLSETLLDIGVSPSENGRSRQ